MRAGAGLQPPGGEAQGDLCKSERGDLMAHVPSAQPLPWHGCPTFLPHFPSARFHSDVCPGLASASVRPWHVPSLLLAT